MIKFQQLLLIIALWLGFMTTTLADPKNDIDHYLPLLPKGTNLSILVQSVKKEPTTLISYNSDKFRQPASVQKIVTALAAQLELGNDFRFITRMYTDGKITDNQLQGDLIIQMSGDPTFTKTQLNNMISVLKLKGIHKITGNIIINTSVFAGHNKASGWSWNNLTACYNTAPSATIIDGNCFYAGILPAKKIGAKATHSISPIYPITLTSNIRTISEDSDVPFDKYCELDMVYLNKNHYRLTGCITAFKQKEYFKFAVLDDIDYFSSILTQLLKTQKIAFNGSIKESKEEIQKTSTPLSVHESQPLSTLLTTMLKKSDNLIADTLFRTIGKHYYQISGTWRNSADAVKAILLEKTGIDLGNVVIADGSGLSRLNLIDANTMMAILQYIAANDDTLHLIEKLPIAGVDGTLQYRKSMSKNTFKSIVYAKTGHLEGHYNLAGFIKQEHGYIAFIQFIANYHYLHSSNEPKNNAIITFEESFYSHLVEH